VVDHAGRGDAVVPHQLVERRDVHECRRLVLHRVERVVRPAVRRVVLDVDARHLGDPAAEQVVPVGLPVAPVLRDDEVELEVGDVGRVHLDDVVRPREARGAAAVALAADVLTASRRTGRYQVTGTCER
jgi:hypothetical protein